MYTYVCTYLSFDRITEPAERMIREIQPERFHHDRPQRDERIDDQN